MKTLALLFLTAAPALAQDLPPGLVSAELLPGWITAEGERMTALHLRLEPGWKTYWRSPGDAGVPPRFDWGASRNLGEVRLLWPRPEVIESGGERTLGYHEELVLPIEIAPARPGVPVEPRAVVDFGICLDICVPVQVALQAGPPGPTPDPRIEAAIARQPEASDRQPECRIARIKDGMQVTATLPAAESARGDEVAMELADDEIWVSAPETREAGGRLMAQADFVAASGKPFPLDPEALRVTLIGPDDAVEFEGCREVAD
ncbi:protein-disulfide reductase DsbD domain-containing protein [Paracoccus sp. J55]|uniref:protein-disulfide reductase DsbD domain-containing protein n=1 Tax=Paracoccus sp. J55 TaxID=935849 RepID=UPI000492185C|nr:protein-disulfide reductase DsbD domain-containing protein [Paracoccus sp. J55]